LNGLLDSISVKSRLSLMLIVVTILSSFIVGLLGWQNGRSALMEAISQQLTSVRASQAYQVERYFREVYSHTRTLSEDRMIVNAMKQFREGFDVGLYRPLSKEQEDAVSTYYEKTFSPQLARAYQDAPLSILFQPKRAVTNYFQYHYIVENHYPSGSKDLLTDAKNDTTIYNRFHRFFHPLLRNIQKEFNYYDIFLIDIESLNISYSVYKETDFATSLKDGPYSESGLGVLANKIAAEPERGEVSVVDYRSYVPSYGEAAAFVGAPIYDGNEAIGVLAIQLSATEVNKIMTFDEAWASNGLGDTGESYLVGSDKMMRSDSRLLIEDRTAFYSDLEKMDLLPSTVTRIQNFNSTKLLQPVVSTSVDFAFEDETGTHLSVNYLGKPVLSSYASLNIPGLNWAIISEISRTEAFSPVAQLQRNILMWGVVLVLMVALLSMLLSRYFVKPIEKLTHGVQQFRNGNTEQRIELESKDEFGELATQFNSLVTNTQEQAILIEQKNDEIDQLLLNILPETVIERVRAGEQVADKLQQLSVIYLNVVGFSELSGSISIAESAERLNVLTENLDQLADTFEVERVRTLGSTYIAAVGLTTARLDHSRRAAEFVCTAGKMLNRLNEEWNSNLAIQAGIDTGSVMCGVVGTRQFQFELWGRTVDAACRIGSAADRNGILVTDYVRERIESFYKFSESPAIKLHGEDICVHELVAESTAAAVRTPAVEA